MTVTLRPAKREEVPAIVAMVADDGLGRGREAVSDPAIYYDAFDAMAGDPNNRLLVAEQNGELVGTLQITFIRGLSRKGARRAQIEAVRVASTHRGQGLGHEIFVAAIALSVFLAGCGGSGSSGGTPTPPLEPLEPHEFALTGLISDGPGAVIQDPDLVNPWSITFSQGGPFWVTDNKTGKATIYNTAGAKQALVVNIAGAGNATNGPVTGGIFNTTPSFVIPGAARANFIFSSLDGTISAWNAGTTSVVVADRSGNNAAYTGLAIGIFQGEDRLFAPNFKGGTVDVFGEDFTLVKSFTDPEMPAGFAPFGIRNIEGNLFVTFGKPGPDGVTAGTGNGFIDVFNPDGVLIKRFATGGHLDNPWGMATAPNGFGGFDNALLVGNFGDGHINAFDIATGEPIGVVADAAGQPFKLDGLWAITFGNGIAGGAADKLYFAAGPNRETEGLFGFLTPAAP